MCRVWGRAACPSVRRGASNLTFLIECANDSVVLRTSPSGRKAASAHDMVREARLLQAIRPQFDLVPQVLAVADEDSPIGRPAFVSEFVRGEILRQDLPDGAPVEQMAQRFITALVDLHSVDTSGNELSAFHKGQDTCGVRCRAGHGDTGRLSPTTSRMPKA